ncbi:nitrogen fixation protein NifZ [Frankia sp. AgB32]|uniref:nitrogen fixation protein NifZ n=1 Tax=Frankia sp. AgB32 TaxID=631119 RepID=UPI00200CB9BC|nr:nitrogen fixation protein NifZ [Frankia sp. AgB32]MCK9893237.1 nitrogen fixation protein NifZ [Frankia sp. AgB32]
MSSNTYDVGDVVVTVKELRNDGTYPDPAVSVGEVLVEAGTRGEVINVGLYLQEHIVYAVAFRNGRVVGALERELAPLPDGEGEPTREPSAPPVAVPIATSVSTSAPTADEHHGGSGGGCKHGKADCSGGGGKGHGHGDKAGSEPAAKSTVAGAAGGKDGPR